MENKQEKKCYDKKRYDENKFEIIQKTKDRIKLNSHKHRARANAQNNIEIIRGTKCQRCKVADALERHHPDYSKQLDVMLLCKSCHRSIHAEEKRKKDFNNWKKKLVEEDDE